MIESLAEIRLADILHTARSRNASDVHLVADSPPVLRVDGALTGIAGSVCSHVEIRQVLDRLIDDRRRAELIECGDVTTSLVDPEFGALRVYASSNLGGTAIAIRLLCQTIPALNTLELPPSVTTLSDRQHGLVIFAGPTGSGKSTSLASLVDRMNASTARRIVTIEDPIEYRHANKQSFVTQREIGRDVHDFSKAINGSLRGDPDVIVVGEMRDRATMRAALGAAETGHLVVTSLHTGDAPQTVERIIDAFDGDVQGEVRAQLAQVLVAVVCQRLVCRAYRRGRRAVAEVMIVNGAIRALIRDRKTHHIRNVIATGRQAGMQTLEQHLAELVSNREIELVDAQCVTDRPDEVSVLAGTSV